MIVCRVLIRWCHKKATYTHDKVQTPSFTEGTIRIGNGFSNVSFLGGSNYPIGYITYIIKVDVLMIRIFIPEKKMYPKLPCNQLCSSQHVL